MKDSELKYWIALSTGSEIGAKTFAKLRLRFNLMEEVWKASISDLEKKKIEPKIIKVITEVRKKANPDEELKKVRNLGVEVVTIVDKEYPRLLKEIPDAPALLYVKGELRPEDELAMAVVGSRRYTDYGERATKDIVKVLAEAGVTVISGLALGIDTIAHKSAIGVKGGRTIAVLGSGIDYIYPFINKKLAQDIGSGRGALITEFPLGTPSLKQNFPFRNRIIAGLALGTLVIEGALLSGSLITARAALDYNREVFAVPGSIYSPMSEGTNNLIKMGGKMVTSASDILDELNIQSASKIIQAKKIIPDTREEAVVLGFLDQEKPVHVDKLTKLAKLDISCLNSTLVLMEMKGKVRNLGGNQYVLG